MAGLLLVFPLLVALVGWGLVWERTCFISTLPSARGAVASADRGGEAPNPRGNRDAAAETRLEARGVNGAQPPRVRTGELGDGPPPPNRDPSPHPRRYCCQVESATDTQVSP